MQVPVCRLRLAQPYLSNAPSFRVAVAELARAGRTLGRSSESLVQVMGPIGRTATVELRETVAGSAALNGASDCLPGGPEPSTTRTRVLGPDPTRSSSSGARSLATRITGIPHDIELGACLPSLQHKGCRGSPESSKSSESRAIHRQPARFGSCRSGMSPTAWRAGRPEPEGAGDSGW